MRTRSLINDVGHWWKSMYTYGDYKDLPFPRHLSRYWCNRASWVIPLVGGCGKVLLTLGNSVKVHKRENLLEYIHNRGPLTPLITYCNHTSMTDDPFLIGYLCDWKWLINPKLMRWSLGAKELVYANRLTSYFMAHGKVIPAVRGDGVFQPGVTYAIEQLNKGHWVHLFPEGKITLDPIRMKWGIGRIISECTHDAIVLPFWHSGMEDFFPTKKPYHPRLGKKVTVLFGEPIQYQTLLQQCRSEGCSETATRKALTDLIQDALYKLKPEAERLHLGRMKK